MTKPLSAEPNYVHGHGLLDDKRVLITAAAGAGIGVSAAQRCLEEGAVVTIADIHERRLGETHAALNEQHPGKVSAFLCNVTQQDQVDALVTNAIQAMGRIDVLINNAGLGGTANVVDMTDDQWSQVIDITLTGTFRMTRAVLAHMYESGGGVIVNNASVLGWRAQKGQAHYAAAKAGVMALTRCSAAEGAEHGVRVNAVSPSLAMHPFLEKVMDPVELEGLVAKEMYGRAAKTWEVANVMVFLASDYSSYMTGEIVSVSSQNP